MIPISIPRFFKGSESPTVYVNSYYIANHYREQVLASKHYYMGSQRIASSLINRPYHPPGWGEPAPGEEPGEGEDGYTNPPLEDGYSELSDGVIVDMQATLRELFDNPDLEMNQESFHLQSLGEAIEFNCSPGSGAEYEGGEGGEGGPGESEYIDPLCACEQSLYWANAAGYDCQTLNVIYFYHPDYLGSVEYVTDMRGEPYQFFLNTPWGENVENQFARNYTAFSSRFRFNEGRTFKNRPVAYFSEGARLPRGRGNFYYGARYVVYPEWSLGDPKISVWLSVDPLTHEFPGWSPYNFTMNSPLNLVDPDGMAPGGPEGEPESQWYPFMLLPEASNNDDFIGPKPESNEGGNNLENSNLVTINFQLYLDRLKYDNELMLNSTKQLEQGVNDAQGVLGISMLSLIQYRKSLPLSEKIGTFSRFRSYYGPLSVGAKWAGRGGAALSVLSLGNDFNSTINGDISVGRFTYRATGFGAGFATGFYVGGPQGAVLGLAVGSIFNMGEHVYDNVISPGYDNLIYEIGTLERSLNSGQWYPRF